jgi:hypothetical protein
MKAELEEMLDEDHFQPFTLTTLKGLTITIDNPRKTLISRSMIVVLDKDGNLIHIPFTAIAHLSEPQQDSPQDDKRDL